MEFIFYSVIYNAGNDVVSRGTERGKMYRDYNGDKKMPPECFQRHRGVMKKNILYWYALIIENFT